LNAHKAKTFTDAALHNCDQLTTTTHIIATDGMFSLRDFDYHPLDNPLCASGSDHDAFKHEVILYKENVFAASERVVSSALVVLGKAELTVVEEAEGKGAAAIKDAAAERAAPTVKKVLDEAQVLQHIFKSEERSLAEQLMDWLFADGPHSSRLRRYAVRSERLQRYTVVSLVPV
jgi:hypothetical protein